MQQQAIYQESSIFADRQFLFFLVQNILLSIFDKIDQSFGNHLSIDSICVLSSYAAVTLTTYSLYSFGSYAFRSVLKCEKECLALQMLTSVFVGMSTFIFAGNIAGLYKLTPVQNEMLCICLKIHGVSCPVLALREYLGNYAEYKCLNKIAATGNILLYGSMILTDLAVVTLGSRTLISLLFWTPLCSLLYAAYMWKKIGLLKHTENFTFHNFVFVTKNGFNLWINRLTSRIATMCGALYASKLPTIEYSIHSVCYGAAVFGECVTNALHTNIIVKVRKYCTSLTESWVLSKQIFRKLCIPIILIVYALCYIVLSFLIGKAPFGMSMAWGWIYFTRSFSFLLYETVGACLIGSGYSRCIRWGGLLGAIACSLFVIVGWQLGFGLVLFALMGTVDFFIRGLYYYIELKKEICLEKQLSA